MAEILMINVPFAGHTNPTIPLTKALVNNGHNVSYINSEEYRTIIEDTGALFIPYKEYPATPTERQKAQMSFRAAFDTAVNVKNKYDLLIYEMFFYPGFKVAEILDIPCIRQFSQPAWNNSTLSDATFGFKLSCLLIDINVMGIKNKLRMGLVGTNLKKAILNDKPSFNIVYVPRLFQKDRESFNTDYLFTIPKNDIVSTSQDIPFKEMKPPIIYISLGSIISKKGFYNKCIRSFGAKDVSVILNTGKVKPESLGKIPENIYAYSFVPQIEILQHADVFVTHCGMNSVNEAMMHGVPMVTVPLENDQISNAIQISKLGIGKTVGTIRCSGKQLFNAVMDVNNNEIIKRRCFDVQQLVLNETGIDEVIIRINSLLSQRRNDHGVFNNRL
jgi:MGT family glycosyltransferase